MLRRFASLSLSLASCAVLSSCAAAPGTSTGSSALEESEAVLHFDGAWNEWTEGTLRAGRTIRIDYDISRLPCRDSRYGRPAWSIQVHHRMNGGPVSTTAILGHEAYPGANSQTIDLTEEGVLEVWFENTSVSGCHVWDSSFGENYRYEVTEDPRAPGWMGNAVSVISRATCDDGRACDADRVPLSSSVEGRFRYDTWARQRAAIRQVSFDVWKAGVTDRADSELWRELDVRVHYRYGAESEWQWEYVDLERRVGNDARYTVRLIELDPQGGNTRTTRESCPDAPLTLDPTGMYVRTPIELYFTVNGHALRADDGQSFRGEYEDYAGLYAPCDVR